MNIYSTIIKVYSHFLIQKLVRLTCRILRFLNKSLYFADFSEIKTRPSDIQISLNIFHNLRSPSYRVICMLNVIWHFCDLHCSKQRIKRKLTYIFLCLFKCFFSKRRVLKYCFIAFWNFSSRFIPFPLSRLLNNILKCYLKFFLKSLYI